MGNLVLDLGQGRMFEWHVEGGNKILWSALYCVQCTIFPYMWRLQQALWQNWSCPVGLSFPTSEMTSWAIGLWGLPLSLSMSCCVSDSLREWIFNYICRVWNSSNRGKECSPRAKKPLPVEFKLNFRYSWMQRYFWWINPFFASFDVTWWTIGIV